MRQEHARLVESRSRFISAPPPLADLVDDVQHQVSAFAKAWWTLHGDAFLARRRRGISSTIRPAPWTSSRATWGTSWPGALPADLAALVPDLIVQAFADQLRTRDFSHAGPPMGERLRLIAEVDRQLAAVVEEHSQVVDEAQAAGIGLSLLEEGARGGAEAGGRGGQGRAGSELVIGPPGLVLLHQLLTGQAEQVARGDFVSLASCPRVAPSPWQRSTAHAVALLAARLGLRLPRELEVVWVDARGAGHRGECRRMQSEIVIYLDAHSDADLARLYGHELSHASDFVYDPTIAPADGELRAISFASLVEQQWQAR